MWRALNKVFLELKSKTYTFITEGNRESKKAEDINKCVVGDELKYGDYNKFLFNTSHFKHEINKIQSKDHNTGSYKINKISIKFLYFLTMKRKVYLRIDIVDYQFFINLLVNHIKRILSDVDNLYQFLLYVEHLVCSEIFSTP